MARSNADIIAQWNNKKEKGSRRQVALEDILEVFGCIPTLKVSGIKLKEIDSDSFTIQYRYNDDLEHPMDVLIPIDNEKYGDGSDPEEMDEILTNIGTDATKSRGLSSFQINEVKCPSSLVDWLIILGVTLPTLCYLYRPVLYYLFECIPSFGYSNIKETLVTILDDDFVIIMIIISEFVIHFVETWFLLRPKLLYYRVPTDFILEWYFFGILEGYGPVKRLEQLAQKYKISKDKKE
ncbi:uncharacterized protein NDAI_0H00950 [Naumovozyma dairenensis CBS 421]|uniref:DUF2470 domain-containing protein n=1 Tax=Naumovozyma dairenensis (strain ATCC 10597 / BCRC 20456 / CBS 421 / NBRC 0211 / NRRL Y-12639) TaxID=1071378 RepID=G0WEQ8_NAUDC|nr:hypothetical protein NDAI_0H00950 [Naumovozyma dairenensis CBS 421]CCD26269.1 hypothetical protein NDAI_0H00950 [Naumovozyma dairenensis CBS 421]